MNARPIAASELAGVELQPLAELSVALPRLLDDGWAVSVEHDLQLGSMMVAAVQVGDVRYLLRTYDDAVRTATEIHTVDTGDPVEQLRLLFVSVPGLSEHLQSWWDGAGWRPAPLPQAA